MSEALKLALGDGVTLLFTALRVALVYVGMLLLLRLAGKRTLGQMTPFDLLTLLLLSNAVQNAMIGPDNSLTGGLLAAAILLLLGRAVASSSLRQSLEGSPTILIRDGQILPEALRREGIQLEELEAALREHGVSTPEQVASAVLEIDGTISVVPMEGHGVRKVRHVKSSRNR
jgi:uncharacterized membrane protein YcaP (DUF421 family)